jgi:hypothetical protein
MIDKLSEWFGEDTLHRNEERLRRFWRGEERFMVSLTASDHWYRPLFDDAERLRRVPRNLEALARLPGLNLPSVYPDFGTCSMPRYWGGQTAIDPTQSFVSIEPVAQTLDEALARTPGAVDDPAMDAAKALQLYRDVSAHLSSRWLWARTPDMQGPLNTAGMVMNQEELLMGMYSEPEKVHALLDRVTGLLAGVYRFLINGSGKRLCGSIWPYTSMPCELGVTMTEDLMPLLSPELYKEFGLPYVKRIADEFGGLVVHCCGVYGQHVANLAESGVHLRGLEFHYPHTPVEVLEPVWGKTVLIPMGGDPKFGSQSGYFEHLLRTTPESVRYWFFFCGSNAEAIAFARKHGF